MPASGNRFARAGNAERAQNSRARIANAQRLIHCTGSDAEKVLLGLILRKTRKECPWFLSPYNRPITVRK